MQRHDVYESITDRVIAAIEEGAGQWQMPWHRSGVSRPQNAHTKKPYRGVNVVALWAAADAYGYSSGFWATYKQWHELGAQVRRGERASLIVFWKELEREVEDEETGERERKKSLFARASWVFNADQVDRLDATCRTRAEPRPSARPCRSVHGRNRRRHTPRRRPRILPALR